MTARDRLLRLFRSQDIDAVPIWLLFPFHPLGCYADVYKSPGYRPLLPLIDKHCVTLDRRNYGTGSFCYNSNAGINTNTFTEEINGVPAEVHEIRYKDLALRKFIETSNTGKRVRWYAEDTETLKKIAAIPYVKPVPDFSAYQKEKEELGDRGLMMMDLGDPLTPLYQLTSPEDFSMWTLTDYDVMLEFTDAMYERVIDVYKMYLENNIGDVFFIVGAEFAGPPLVSPAKFNELSVRYVKGIVDLIRSYGKFSIVHYHGNLFRVLPGMKEINPDGLHTIEAPPIGDCTLTQAREELGNMVLIGNIQYDDLRSQNPGGIANMVKSAITEAKDGRFILSPTAGPYEENITQHQLENYTSFIEAGVKYGRL